MTSKGRFKVLAAWSIFALMLGLLATIGMLRSTTAVKAASPGSLNYHGVDRMGTEYSCLSGNTFDGPADQASVSAMLSWKINIVRVPMNEDCWLGINGEPTGSLLCIPISAKYYQLREPADRQWNACHSRSALDRSRWPEGDRPIAYARRRSCPNLLEFGRQYV